MNAGLVIWYLQSLRDKVTMEQGCSAFSKSFQMLQVVDTRWPETGQVHRTLTWPAAATHFTFSNQEEKNPTSSLTA